MQQRDWNNWLNEYVSCDVYDELPRRTAIYRLCKRGLIPFLQSHGYAVEVSIKELGSRIATGLYINRGKSYCDSNWKFGYPEELSLNCDYRDRYYHVIDSEEWDKFWEIWGTWIDLDADSFRGADRRFDIQEYMWTQICHERSEQTRIVNEFLGIEDGQDVSEYDNRDTYLRDAAESNEWGGYRK